MDEQASRALKRQMDRRRGAAIIDGNLDSFRADGYTNLLTKYGTSQDSSNYWNYERENYEDDLHLLSLYEGNGLFAKIIDIPSEEAVKHGLDIDWKDDNISEYIEKRLDELDFEDKFSTAEKWARLYGGAIGVLITNDGKGLEEPLDMNGFRSIEEIRVFERAIVQPDYSRLGIFQFEDSLRNNTPYNEPEFYTVSSIYGYFTVHRSRCLLFRNGRLPEQTTSENYRYWGMPEYVRIKRALRECQTSHGLGVRLLERCSQAIYKMKNLANLLSTDQGEEQVLRRLQVIDMARGILNSISIDSDGEDYDFKSNSMAGVKDIIDSTCNMLSAVTNIPQTRLFGRSPAGENATGKSDQENYYSMVENIQKQNMKKNVRKLLDLVLRQGVIEGKLDSMPDYKVKFAALWSLDDQEQAQLDQTKAATEKTKADTLNVYMQAQVIDPSEVRAGLASKDALDIEALVDDTEPVDAGETTEGMDPAMQAGMEDAAAQIANAALQQVRANPDEPSMGESTTDPATDQKATELATAALTAIKGGLDQQADDVTIKPKQAENGPIPGALQADPDGRATAFAEAALAAVKKNNTDGLNHYDEWKTINGTHVEVDNGGGITKGPSGLLNYSARRRGSGTGIKSYMDDARKFLGGKGAKNVVTGPENFTGTLSGAIAYVKPDDLDTIYVKGEKELGDYVASHKGALHPNASAKSVMVHEMAHSAYGDGKDVKVVDEAVKNYEGSESFKGLMAEDPSNKYLDPWQVAANGVSHMAGTTKHEFFAEAMADYYANGNKAKDISKEIYKLASGESKNYDGDDTKRGVGVIIMNGDRVLCGVRSDNGQICGPGGHIRDDETPEQAAVRETQEEFGVTPTGLTVIGHTTPAPGSADCPSTVYLAAGFAGTIHTDHEEMNGAIWATPDELTKAALFEPFKESLKFLDFSADKREDGAPIGNTNAAGSHKGYINKHARESAKKVIGTKTGAGVEVKQFSTHAMQRMSERNMYDKAVLNALKDPNPEKDTKHNSDSAYIYEYPRKNGNFYTVIVDHNSGTVITTINPKKSKKGKGNGEKDTSGSKKP